MNSLPSTSTEGTPQSIAVERTYDVPVEKVWNALVSPEAIKKWFFQFDNFKPEPGCEFSFVVEHEGFVYDHRCRVVEVSPPERFSFTWRYAGFEGDSLVTFELAPEGKARTRVKLIHSGVESFPKLPAFAAKNFEAGWNDLVGRSLKDFTEGKNS
jgi:uncharacterized protein YndB with AHSA1/START domain